MKQLIFLKNYNNYFNRTIFSNKWISPEQIIHKLNNPSFNVNDGIRTSQIVNADVSKCDYAILCEDTSLNRVKARVFVSDTSITELKQGVEYTLYSPNTPPSGSGHLTLITSSNLNVFKEYTSSDYTEVSQEINFNQMEIYTVGLLPRPLIIKLYQIQGTETNLVATINLDKTAYYTFHFLRAFAEVGNKGLINGLVNGYLERRDFYEIKEAESRWFILEAIKQRTGQYLLNLKRDVLADNLTSILESPMFVEKGTLEDDDEMIFNDEGMIFNKIKTEESLLKGVKYGDAYNSAWIVGYVTKQELRKLENEEPGTDILGSVTVSPYESATQFPSVSEVAKSVGISESTLISILTNENFEIITKNFNVNFGVASKNPFMANTKGQISYSDIGDNIYNAIVDQWSPWGTRLFESGSSVDIIENVINRAFKEANQLGYAEDIKKIFQTNEGKVVLTREEYEKLKTFQGIYYNNTNYNLTFNQVTDNSSKEIRSILSDTNNAKLKQAFESQIGKGYVFGVNSDAEVYFYVENFSTITITKKVSTFDSFVIPFLTADNRPGCNNSPCDIFVIPFNDIRFTGLKNEETGEYITQTSEITINNVLNIASQIAKQLGSQLYDIQLLPYAELPLTTGTVGSTTVNNVVDIGPNIGQTCSFITKNKLPVSFIYWLSSPSFVINSSDYIPTSVSTITNPKIQSQTQMCRIVSPTGQGMFDFNPAKNGGLKSYRINCTLKPYSPYIQILPIFNKLYGSDFNDYRGLICSGDFSLSRVQSAWIEYQLQNKNYQNIFNREMQNLDFNQGQEAKLQGWSVASGTLGGAAAGAIGGGVAAGPWGAVAGAVVGGASSLAGGVIDLQMAEQKRFETKDYAKDRYSYQLGNVKAIPNSITKVGTFVVNSKIFPFIEVYDCSSKEKEALENKLKYDGMTVNRIGSLSEFRGGDNNQQFVKGQMIKLNDLAEDSHTANEIYDELLKGVYI